MPPTDRKGRTIKVGDQVMFRGRAYTVSGIGAEYAGAPALVFFEEPLRSVGVADVSNVDLIPVVE